VVRSSSAATRTRESPTVARATVVGLLVFASFAGAQSTNTVKGLPASPAFSMGQPRQWLPYASAFAIATHGGGAGALLGVDRPLLNPVTGLLGVSGEVELDRRRRLTSTAVRVVATAPALGLALGGNFDVGTQRLDALITFRTAIRRGGLLGHGTMARVDWLATGSHALYAGIQIPLGQPFAGRTRPRETVVAAPSVAAPARTIVSVPEADDALRRLNRAANAIQSYATLYAPNAHSVSRAPSDALPASTKYDDVVRAYDAALAGAFAAVMRDSVRGAMVAGHARQIEFNDVLLRYDALFGQVKESTLIDGHFDAARSHFALWLSDSARVDPSRREAAMAVFDEWQQTIARIHRRLLDQWKDSRLVWLPPQLALAPDAYDEQQEVESTVGRVVGRAFTGGNTLAYLRTADLPLEIARSIMAAKRFHVLWTHDFTGRRPSGRLDEISLAIAADAYIPALTAAVQSYDSVGTLPQYFILLDAFYYHGRDGRLWMDVLEHPLTAGVHLRDNESKEADHLRQRLEELRTAVRHSERLQREAARHGGDAWLAQVVKVHVNVVLPSDFSFRSARLVPPIPFTADNIVRDHRKLALYDLSDENPEAGQLLVTGIGIGEHYASATWEDRGYRVRGPAALEALHAVRRTLRANGLTDVQLPEALRDTGDDGPPRATTDTARSATHVLQVHNAAGFGDKQSSVARAMLYSLAPAGSVIIVPDPLWVSDVWASMLMAAAARGCRVVIIAPAAANAPSPEAPILVLEREMLHNLLAFRSEFAKQLRDAGGELRVGIYAAHAPVTDAAGRLAEIRDGLRRAPWIRQLIPFDDAELATLDRATADEATASSEVILARDDTPREPQLHQKTIFIARPGAIAALVRQPGWANVLARTIRAQSRETARLANALAAPAPAPDTAAIRAADLMLQGYERTLSEAERRQLSFVFVAGTQNHDDRGLLLDAETSVIVSGFDASAGLVDLFYLMARSTWIERSEDIDRFVPQPRGWIARLAGLIRRAM
jgi:hypothetical protein